MDRRIALPLLAAVGAVFACGPLPHFGSGLPVHAPRLAGLSGARTAGRPAAAPKRHRWHPGAPELDAALAVSPASGGDAVRFALAVVNASDRRVEVEFPDGRTRDFAVYDSAGRELWRASRGRLYTQLVQNTLLAAGDSVVYETAWRPPAPGRYAVVAELRSSNHPAVRRDEFVVAAPGAGAPSGAPGAATSAAR